jgi:hypothetical protein
MIAMSFVEMILRLIAVVLLVPLVGYLFSRHHQRVSARLARTRGESQLEGTAMDVTVLRSRLGRVRADYTAHARPHNAGYRACLLALARQALGRLAYFHYQPEEQHPLEKPCR